MKKSFLNLLIKTKQIFIKDQFNLRLGEKMIVGINFTKLVADRLGETAGRIDINNNIRITNINEAKLVTAKGDKALEIEFEFTSKYEPNLAQIIIVGKAVYVNKEKEAKEILKGWEKDKKVPEKYLEEILSGLLMRANVEAVLLSKEINIPPPIPMPRIGKRSTNKVSGDKSYIG